jgi:hypothetical protein
MDLWYARVKKEKKKVGDTTNISFRQIIEAIKNYIKRR